MKICGSKKGFTLIELIAVIAIMTLLMVVAIPSVLSYIEAGRQAGRESTARTLYLAAQSRLTGIKLAGGLEAFSDEFYTGGEPNAVSLVYGPNVPAGDGEAQENRSLVRYISKSKGAAAEGDPVTELLAPQVMDEGVLHGAILIEYNVKTGVVLSVFYSDVAESFSYSGTGGSEDVTGSRPYYEHAARKQGYYGVGATGQLEKGAEPMVVELYDGAGEENGQSTPLVIAGKEEKNALYAEIFLHESFVESGRKIELRLLAKDGKTKLFASGPLEPAGAPQSAETAISSVDPHIFYRDMDYLSDDGYQRYIWLIDYVGGDMTARPGVSIGVKYGAALAGYAQDIRAGVSAEGSALSAVSVGARNPYYSGYFEHEGESGTEKVCGITSARHLYNVRYAPEARFAQLADVDLDEIIMEPLGVCYDALAKSGDGIDYTGFTPAAATSADRDFEGSITAAEHFVIDYAVVKYNGAYAAGLFGTIGRTGSVTGLTVRYASVLGKNVTGVFCGENKGLLSAVTAVDCTVAGASLSGGIAGRNAAGGKLFDALFIHSSMPLDVQQAPAAPDASIPPVAAVDGSAGGIVGENGGTLARAAYLAVAPSGADGFACYPIAYAQADGSGAQEAYYLSGEGLRPVLESYNTAAAEVGEGLSTDELYAKEIFVNYRRNTVAEPLQLDITEQAYFPYEFFAGESGADYIAPVPIGYPWPVVKYKAQAVTGRLAYYEMYEDDAVEYYGLWYYEDGALVDTIKSSVEMELEGVTLMETGYGLLSEQREEAVALTLGAQTYSGLQFTALDAGSGAPEGFGLYPVNSEDIVPQESLLPAEAKLNDTAIEGVWCLPNFARGVYTAQEEQTQLFIRTARQLRSITPVCGERADYWQELDIHMDEGSFYVGGDRLERSAVDGEFKGNYSGYYSGEFSDDIDEYHEISGLTMTLDCGGAAGLFSEVSGELRYVSLTGADIRGSSGDAAGAVAGAVFDGGELYGCTVEGVMAVTSGGDVGAVAGRVEAGGLIENSYSAATLTHNVNADSTGGVTGANYGILKDCYNAGAVTGRICTGGVAGICAGDMDNCYNAGTVTGRANTGGAAGQLSGTMAGCYNIGMVSAGTYSTAGGVAGSADAGAYINNCFNTGSVTASSRVGGIAGNAAGLKIYNCFNSGWITAGANVANAGGIAGGASAAEVEYCTNSGRVSASASSGYNSGGIAGGADGGTKLRFCANYGRVSAYDAAGGIVGSMSGSNVLHCNVSECSNNGAVSVSSSRGGGIAGRVSYTDIDNSYNRGEVSGSSRTGGLAGQAEYDSQLSYCYNAYRLTLGSNTGSLVGYRASGADAAGCFAVNYTGWSVAFFGNNLFYTGDNAVLSETVLKGDINGVTTGATALNAQSRWTRSPSDDANGGFPVLLSAGYTGDADAPFRRDGSAYIVSNAYQLDQMRNYSDEVRTFRLDRNITLAGDIPDWEPLGTVGNGANLYRNAFIPSVDGAGFGVFDISVNAQDAGLFGAKSGGAVTNLTAAGSVYGTRYAGGIAAASEAKLEDCRSVADVALTGRHAEAAGGVVGRLDGIGSRLYGNGVVNSAAAAGGAIGSIEEGDAAYIYGTGSVTGAGAAGGAVGAAGGEVLNAYSVGIVAPKAEDGSSPAVGYGEAVFDDAMLYHFAMGAVNDGPEAPEQNSAVYYERYLVTAQDGTASEVYGFYFFNSGENAASTLLTPDGENVVLMDTGYGVLSDKNSASAQISWNGVSYHSVAPRALSKTPNFTGYRLYVMDMSERDIQNAGLISAQVIFAGERVGSCLPVGAKGIYKADGEQSGIVIRTAEQLGRITALAAAEDISGVTFTQELPLDLSGEDYGASAVAGDFSGIYDGCGNSVEGLTIAVGDTASTAPAGLFESVSGQVKSLALTGVQIDNGGAGPTGAVAGRVTAGGRVTACSVEADGSAVSGAGSAGGIAGENAGAITECRSLAAVDGAVNAGGLAGVNTGSIANCYSRGGVTGAYAGGLAGKSSGTLSYCYATGSVEGANTGGFAGTLTGGAVEHCFFTGALSGTVGRGGVAAVLLAGAGPVPTVDAFSAYLAAEGDVNAFDFGNVTTGADAAAHKNTLLDAQAVWADYQGAAEWSEDTNAENDGYPLLVKFVPAVEELSLSLPQEAQDVQPPVIGEGPEPESSEPENIVPVVPPTVGESSESSESSKNSEGSESSESPESSSEAGDIIPVLPPQESGSEGEGGEAP